MAKKFPSRFFHFGPLSLVAATLVAIAIGAVAVYARSGVHTGLLYYFFLPIAASAVVLGWRFGVALAAATIVALVVPSVWLGLAHLVPENVGIEDKIITVASWAVFLLITAWLIGWVSERGGNLALTRGLGAKALQAIERERRRTGQDIHDGIAQYAAAALLQAEVLEHLADKTDPLLKAQVEKVKQPLASLVTEARSMVGTLRPPPLGPDEFEATYSKLVKDFESRTGIRCDLDLDGDFSIHSDSLRICLYRVTQEALNNVERHSQASAVRIWAHSGKGAAHLVIQDNGKGFSPEEVTQLASSNSGFGLAGIKERVAYLGGKASFHSAVGQGTTLSVYIPAYREEKRGNTN
ncbi:MAG: sensor histidine kinase [Thermoleophilia bacterium]|nr:sensor histidine kinase [Thermoleophilia bacterium]